MSWSAVRLAWPAFGIEAQSNYWDPFYLVVPKPLFWEVIASCERARPTFPRSYTGSRACGEQGRRWTATESVILENAETSAHVQRGNSVYYQGTTWPMGHGTVQYPQTKWARIRN